MQRRIDGCPNCGRHTVAYAWEPDGEGVRMHFRCTVAGVNGLPATGFLRPSDPHGARRENICARRTRLCTQEGVRDVPGLSVPRL